MTSVSYNFFFFFFDHALSLPVQSSEVSFAHLLKRPRSEVALTVRVRRWSLGMANVAKEMGNEGS